MRRSPSKKRQDAQLRAQAELEVIPTQRFTYRATSRMTFEGQPLVYLQVLSELRGFVEPLNDLDDAEFLTQKDLLDRGIGPQAAQLFASAAVAAVRAKPPARNPILEAFGIALPKRPKQRRPERPKPSTPTKPRLGRKARGV